MPSKLWRLVIVLATISLLVVGLSLPSLASTPNSPGSKGPAPHGATSQVSVSSNSDQALAKLAPDLRQKANQTEDQTVLVTVLTKSGTNLDKLMVRSVTSKPLGDIQWTTGEVAAANLLKLASVPGVISVTSTETYQLMPAPGMDELRRAPLAASTANAPLERSLEGGKRALLEAQQQGLAETAAPRDLSAVPIARDTAAPQMVQVADIHNATDAHDKGYTGTGVVAAVVDTGVDFGNPDLQGTQARLSGGPYDGWPYAYDTLSGVLYGLDTDLTIGPDTYWNIVGNSWYVHTLPVEEASCDGDTCTADLVIDYGELSGWPWTTVELPFTWPDSSQSGQYYYSVHPDFNHIGVGNFLGLGYAFTHAAPAAVIVSDATTAGAYDTVYVDVDFDQDLTAEKPMTKGDELAGADIFDSALNFGQDGKWDLSASMLTWIADGSNPPPGVSALYPNINTPDSGRLLVFVGDAESHGTNVASQIVAQSVMTDPDWIGNINPFFAGAANAGGVGGPVLSGMAPDARVAAFQNGFVIPLDAWTLAALGFDGLPETGDEAQLVNNSWGISSTIEDGWDFTSRFAHYLNTNYAPSTLFFNSTGNGGAGYGTAAGPDGGSMLGVGASTSYGSTVTFEWVMPDQFTWGDVQPWSNRGPGMLGDTEPDLVCVGAWGTGANPLNFYFNGEAAYDLFGGTSMSSPVCVGVGALVYDAYFQTHGTWPTWQEAFDALVNGGIDLGYETVTQGSGNANAARSTDIVTGEAPYVTPSQWQVGDYRGTDYEPFFPSIVHAGDSVSTTLTVHNPTTNTLSVNLSDTTLQNVHEITFTVPLTAGGEAPFAVPSYLLEITDLVAEHDPDLVRAQVRLPYSTFDLNGDYFGDNALRALFYDWTDLNGDGNLWTDDNGNGLVEPSEIDIENQGQGGFEYNRYSYGYPEANYLEVSVGRDALSRQHDGVFFGLQRAFGADEYFVDVSIRFYKKVDWPWLTLSQTSVDVPGASSADVTATVAVPADARVGFYEGAVEYNGQLVPVAVHVAAEGTSFDFGAASLDEPQGDHPYDNGHLFGNTDWGWRPETGDWKLFYFDVPDDSSRPGRSMIVDTEWNYPEPLDEVPPLPPSLLFEDFEAGIPEAWTISETIGSCVWTTTDVLGRDNFTGGEGVAAAADSDLCGIGMNTTLTTSAIDLSGETAAWLAFRSDFQSFDDLDEGFVEISTDGGDTWEQLLYYDHADYPGPRSEVIDISAYMGSVETHLRFHYVAPEWDWWWQVDDIGIFLEDPSDSYAVVIRELTDVDTWVYSATPDDFSSGDPATFGPSGVTQTGGSADTWLGGGAWAFNTATDGAREVVGSDIKDGLGFIALHNVLNSGKQFGEPVVGRTYQVDVSPSPVEITATELISDTPPTVGGSWTTTFTSTRTISGGLAVAAFGLNRPINLTDEVVAQDDPNNFCTANWIYPLSITNGALLDVTTTSDVPGLDIDLFVLLDGGDGVFDCIDDNLLGVSTTITSEEQVTLDFPADGDYWIIVHGWSVPGGSQPFDIHINAIYGTDLTVTNVPTGSVTANTPVTFDVSYALPQIEGSTWHGLLYVGPDSAPTAISIPVTIHIAGEDGGEGELSADLKANPVVLTTGEVSTFTLTVANDGAAEEDVTATIPIPSRLNLVIGSQSASTGTAFYQLTTRTLSWSGTLGAGETATLTYDVQAGSGAAVVNTEATAQGHSSGSTALASATVWVNVTPEVGAFNALLPIAADE